MLSSVFLSHAYWGPSFSGDQIEEQLNIARIPYLKIPEDQLSERVAEFLTDQKVVGWFQRGSEWGPRALGARSIIADPRREEVRDQVNRAVKYRDWWRPFAPSMLAEVADEFLEGSFFSPFMVVTFPVKSRFRSEIAGVTHLDGTTRPQMVRREANPRYYDMIQAFGKKTGLPLVLNTSFNLKGEPMVNTPRDALRTFFSSGLDALIMNGYCVEKTGNGHTGDGVSSFVPDPD
jgi:carbamoyltransferase